MSKYLLAAVAATLIPCAAMAQDDNSNAFVGARVSTLGAGFEIGAHLTPRWTFRGLFNGYDQNYHSTSDNVHYDGKLKLGSAGGQFDYSFSDYGPFYASVGLYDNNNKVKATGTPLADQTIDGIVVTPADIGVLQAHGRFNDVAPYLGLGVNGRVGAFELNAEVGAYFQGRAKVTVTSNGIYASNPDYQMLLNMEADDLSHDLHKYETYPVVALGARYRF